jgi:hemoglobin
MSDVSTSEPELPAPRSRYERLGGQAALAHVVDQFYQRVLADEQLGPYFAGIDVGRLRQHQAALLATMLGGPNQYTGRDLTQVHGRLHIREDDFRRVAGYLVDVLHEMDVDAAVVDEVAHALVAVRPSIVTPTDTDAAATDVTIASPAAVPSWAGATPPAGVVRPA